MSTPAQRLREDASNLFDLWSASLLSHRLGTSTQMPKFETQRHKENDLYDLTPPLLPNPTPTPAQKLQAQRLKEEANNLVRQKQYASAMKHNLDAASDASDAFKLDPSYIKAYARYAEATDAMFLIQYSEEGYETALKLLDKPKLTPVERKLKEDIERGYDTSKKRIVAVEYAIEESSKEDCSAAPPWRRAFSVIGQMDAHDPKLAGTSASLASR
ncbi:hypothetical protein Moror_2630 [Moniliophthora roreri MCA 2997]|uniref:Uncharacterized protein n=1 Tax=Moniliophthora roreri (strain MCA 2997) TaxID=1381753 RepID=V2WX91_MONRO|nr:hypothetical protein Moror_2630 [Moniliophthora roreri MCA 2997]